MLRETSSTPAMSTGDNNKRDPNRPEFRHDRAVRAIESVFSRVSLAIVPPQESDSASMSIALAKKIKKKVESLLPKFDSPRSVDTCSLFTPVATGEREADHGVFSVRITDVSDDAALTEAAERWIYSIDTYSIYIHIGYLEGGKGRPQRQHSDYS